MQVVRGLLRARQRPLLLITPDVLAHHEDADRRVSRRALVVLEPAIEPARLLRAQINQRLRTKIYLAELLRRVHRMPPWTHQEALAGARFGRCATRRHAGIVLWRADLLVVVPAGDVQHGHVDAVELVLVAEAAP